MGAAAAQVPVQAGSQGRIAGITVLLQQAGQRHHDPVDAIAALRSLLVEKSLQHNRSDRIRRQALGGEDVTIGGRPVRRRARLLRMTVDQYGARAAVALAAAEPYSLPNLQALAESGAMLMHEEEDHPHALPIFAPKVLPDESLNVPGA